MTTLVSEILTFVILVGALLFMVRGARGSTGPAASWRDLGSYELEGQMWAVALLAGMAMGEIVQAVGGGVQSFSVAALGVGVWCGVFRTPTRLSGLVPGTIGAFASVVGSIAFVSQGPTTRDQVFRSALVVALGLLFGLFVLTRAQPLGGLTWFAALDIVVFLSGPGGQSWAQIGGWTVGVLTLAAISVMVALARLAEFVTTLAAFAVIAVQVLGSGFGYLPGDIRYSIAPIVVTMIGFGLTRLVRRRVIG